MRVLIFIFVICNILAVVQSSHQVKYIFSKSMDFTQGIEINKLVRQIETNENILKIFLGITVHESGVIDILFDHDLMGSEMTALNAVVAAHVPDSLSDRFFLTLPDANAMLTTDMINVGLLIAPVTMTRNYTIMSAITLIADKTTKGTFCIVNTGSAPVHLIKGMGEMIKGSAVIMAGTSGTFGYAVIDYTTNSEFCQIIRVS